ncbi:HNH endonuclease signature motif containing protein [Roseovarius sp. MMSF_3350]|uniref:HNH endonuclease signature motif containing protein n=1 Tax=Roseovarius sp. MMSF_3350 TaxID=3046706 RepID=UPI00273F2716|nr:HNH endonuclease signature motif containing protein [Roseovarius sp. MMSF_3350]
MAARPLPTPEELRQLLRYEPETGKLFWLHRPKEMFPCEGSYKTWNSRFAGNEAFTASVDPGYRYGTINGGKFFAHRVAYAIYHGKWPENHTDHINGDPSDNRIANLRDVSQSGNMRNSRKQSNNSSGHTGVYWFARDKKWRALGYVSGRQIYLGLFDSIEDAIAARDEFNKQNSFTDRHGK